MTIRQVRAWRPLKDSVTYRLQVAMDNPLSVKQLEALQEGIGKTPNQRNAKTLEAVLLDQLVEVHAEVGVAQ